MGRTRTGLTATIAALLLTTACGTHPGTPRAAQDPPATTTPVPTTTKPITTHGYTLPKGTTTELYNKNDTITITIGDLIVVQRTNEVTQRPDPAVLSLAEARDDGKLVYQAIGKGKVTLYTADPKHAQCSQPCTGASAPPMATITVT